MWNKSLLQAIEVGKLVEQLLPESISSTKVFQHVHVEFQTKEYYYIEAFQNCREQGITIWIPNCKGNSNLTFYVTQHRNSDDIGFYKGEHQFQGLSKDAYEAGFNSCLNTDQCAAIIAKQILEMFE